MAHELLIAKFRLKLKKIGKSIRPFRYDQNQIPYDYTVEVRNRFKGLDLIECLKKEAVIKTIPKRKKCKKAKWLSEEGLQIAEKRREAKVEWFYEDLQDLLELTLKTDVLFIIGDWNAKVGSQETPGVTGKFGLGV